MTVLITDIVGSTRLVVEIGDQQWRALLDRHDDAVRLQIRRHGGGEIQNRGDGFLATFDTPARAVRSAAAIAASVAPLGLAVDDAVWRRATHFWVRLLGGHQMR